jgi:phytoene desaturase
VGGLATACRLAAAGHEVTVCEATAAVGGKLGTFSHEGFQWDTGANLLTWPDLYRELFDLTGGWPTELELVPLEPLTRYRFADGTTLDASSDPAVMARRVEALSPGSAWPAFAARAERAFRASQPFLTGPVSGAGDLARLLVRRPRDLAAVAPGRTLRSVVTRDLADPRLRAVAERYATYTGSDPRVAPAVLSSVAHVEHAFGGWYVRGGLHRLAAALAERARALGVRVRLSSRVLQVIERGGAATGVVLLDGEVLHADAVVCNADATHLWRDLAPDEKAARRLARATPSLSGFVLLLAVSGRTPGLAHHTVLFGADPAAEFGAVFGSPGRPAGDPTILVSSPDDPAVRPDGHEAWFVLVNAARHGTGPGALDWRKPGLVSSYTELLLDRLAERGLPVRDRVLWSRALSPADLGERTGAPGGAIYGTSSNSPAAAFLRPSNWTGVRGLWLVGGSAHPGGGLPLVALSAKIVADQIGPA